MRKSSKRQYSRISLILPLRTDALAMLLREVTNAAIVRFVVVAILWMIPLEVS
jgi:hypothetical protein